MASSNHLSLSVLCVRPRPSPPPPGQELPSLGLLKEQEAGAAQAIADLEASAQYKEAEAKAFKER
jgi:hypothetical protein